MSVHTAVCKQSAGIQVILYTRVRSLIPMPFQFRFHFYGAPSLGGEGYLYWIAITARLTSTRLSVYAAHPNAPSMHISHTPVLLHLDDGLTVGYHSLLEVILVPSDEKPPPPFETLYFWLIEAPLVPENSICTNTQHKMDRNNPGRLDVSI